MNPFRSEGLNDLNGLNYLNQLRAAFYVLFGCGFALTRSTHLNDISPCSIHNYAPVNGSRRKHYGNSTRCNDQCGTRERF